MNQTLRALCALLLVIVLAPFAQAGAAGCVVTHPKLKTVTGTEVTCTGPPQIATPYVAKMPFRPVLPNIQSVQAATIVIGQFKKSSATFNITYPGQSLLANGRAVLDVRISETNQHLAGKGSRAQRWKAIVAIYTRNAKRFGARIVKLANGHSAIWFMSGQPMQLLSHKLSVQIGGSSAVSGSTTEQIIPRLTEADALTIANSLHPWAKR